MIRRLTAPSTRLSSFRYYDLLVHVFVVILLVSNLVGQKICVIPFVHFFGFVPRVSGAQLLFPITYIFGDIFTEVYGYSASRYLDRVFRKYFADISGRVRGLVSGRAGMDESKSVRVGLLRRAAIRRRESGRILAW